MKVSIITPTYNSEKYIIDTLESIKAQTYPDIEHIVCDNMSSDRTKEICLGYRNVFIQKPDRSMYEALNRGIAMSSGEILCFLNSDDLYMDNETIAKVVNCFLEYKDVDVIYGKCKMVDENLNYLYTHMPNKQLTFGFAIKRIFVISHPAAFIRRRVFEKYGVYDLNLRFMADCEYFLKLLHEHVKFKYYDEVLAVFRRHSDNLSSINKSKASSEVKYIAHKYGYKNSFAKARIYILYDNKFNLNYLKFLVKSYMPFRIMPHSSKAANMTSVSE